MDESSVKDMQRDITDLKVGDAVLATSVQHLSEAVVQLRDTVGELRDIMNRGRGVLWAVGSGAGVIGALASYAAGRMFGS